MSKTPTAPNSPETLNLILAAAVARAQAAAESCVALHRVQNAGLTQSEWSELDAACERWLEKRARARSQEKHAA